jgi:hypothetical protein
VLSTQRQSDVKQKPTRAPTLPDRAKKKPFLRRQTVPLALILSPVAGAHPIADTHSFIRQVGDKSGCLVSFPPSLTPAKLRQTHASVPRNKRISEALFLANYIDKVGTGTLDVIAKCREVGLPEPEFLQNGDQFTVRIWREWLTPALMDRLGLNERQRAAIAFVRETGRINNTELRKLTGASAPTSKRDLEELAKSGLFEVFGGGRSTAYRLCSNRVIFGSFGSRTVTGNGSSLARPAIHFPISASQLFRVSASTL